MEIKLILEDEDRTHYPKHDVCLREDQANLIPLPGDLIQHNPIPFEVKKRIFQFSDPQLTVTLICGYPQ